MFRSSLRLSLLAGAALALSGCMSLGIPGGGNYPYPSPYPDSRYPDTRYPDSRYPAPSRGEQQVAGQVDGVDHRNGRFTLRVESDGYGAYGSVARPGSRIEVNYDQNTRLYYQGQMLSPSGLERGDRIRADLIQSGGRWWASGIEVTQDVRAGQAGYGYGQPLGGAVSYVDTRNRILHFTSGGYSGPVTQVRYDDRTRVEHRGRLLRVENLERGDVVRIEARPWGNQWIAERIIVEVDARGR